MNIDEYKALRLRRTQLQAEIASINARLDSYDYGTKLDDDEETWMPLGKQAERDSIRSGSYRNTDSNGNYVTPKDC